MVVEGRTGRRRREGGRAGAVTGLMAVHVCFSPRHSAVLHNRSSSFSQGPRMANEAAAQDDYVCLVSDPLP